MKKQKKINYIGLIFGILFFSIGEFLFWFTENNKFFLIAILFTGIGIMIGHYSVRGGEQSEVLKLQKLFDSISSNIWTYFILGILFITVFAGLIVFAPNLVQSWLRK